MYLDGIIRPLYHAGKGRRWDAQHEQKSTDMSEVAVIRHLARIIGEGWEIIVLHGSQLI